MPPLAIPVHVVMTIGVMGGLPHHASVFCNKTLQKNSHSLTDRSLPRMLTGPGQCEAFIIAYYKV